ncbi:hypothetical protein [Pseudonocardia broussonetiae]|uniref:Uncharacterized protein n=1 Tax=Pseudonocardia broussonetiae TaxID=2736640 RepID=A0A6M6JVB0_9PSEU|nr:hypothetical protein [Pseudonocardia broussonetiae]QJY51183.1 hypothetical protein HOP40_34955 [Pseudonocardia broussonetiae]
MSAVQLDAWMLAALPIVAWPVVVVAVVVAVLVLVPGERQPVVLASIADLVRAVRSPSKAVDRRHG